MTRETELRLLDEIEAALKRAQDGVQTVTEALEESHLIGILDDYVHAQGFEPMVHAIAKLREAIGQARI